MLNYNLSSFLLSIEYSTRFLNFLSEISQISMELEVNKRHSSNVEKELQEAQIQLQNTQDVMYRLKSKTRDHVVEENNFVSDSNSIQENQMLKKEITSLLKKYV